MFKRFITLIVCFAFIANYCQPVYSQAVSSATGGAISGDFGINQLPVPGSMISTTPAFVPLTLKGMVIHPENALKFDFLMDTGHSHLKGEGLSDEALKIMKYFLTALTIPEDDLWVNLSPYEKGRIIQNNFGQTIMGRDLLAQDYILKQLTSSLIYPEKALGKEFWQEVYSKAAKEYGTTQIPVNTFNKVWIVPSEAVVWEHEGKVLIVKSHLKVMLEEDYLSMSKHTDVGVAERGASSAARNEVRTDGETRGQDPDINRLGSEIVRRIVLPVLEKEVNEGKNFAQLRQMFQAMILATWYKKALKTSILNQVYTDKKKVAGIGYANSVDIEAIYQRYLRAFKKGVYNYIKEDIDPATGQTIPRKYFSGGVDGTNLDTHLTVWKDGAMLTKDQAVDVNHALEATGGDTLSVTGAFNEVGAKAPAEVGINEDSAMIAPAIPYAVAGAISLIGGGFVAKQIASAQEPSLLERKMISSLQRLTSSWDRRRDIEFLASNGTDPRVGPALLDVVRENPNSSNCAFAVLALLELRTFNDQLFDVLTQRIRTGAPKSEVWQTIAEIRSHLGPRSSIPQGSDRAMLNVFPTSFLKLLGDRGLDSIVDRLDSGVESVRRNAKGALLEMLRYEEDPSKRQAVMEAIDRLPPGIKSLEEKYSIYNNAVFFFAHQDVCVWAIHRIGELGRIQLEDLQLPPELKWTTEMSPKFEGETFQEVFHQLEMLVGSTLFKEKEYQEVLQYLKILKTSRLPEEGYPEVVQRLKGLMKLRFEENKYQEGVQQLGRLIKLKFEENKSQEVVQQLERYLNPQYSQAEARVTVGEKRSRIGGNPSRLRSELPIINNDMMKLAIIEELVEFNDMTFLAKLAGMEIIDAGSKQYYRVNLMMAGRDVSQDFRVAAARIFVKKGGKTTLLSFLLYPNDSIRLDSTTRLIEEREELNVSDDDLTRWYQEALQYSDNPAVRAEATKALDALHSKEGIKGIESYVVSGYQNALQDPMGPITDEYYVKLAHAAQALGHLVDLKDEKAVEDAVEVLAKALNREIKPVSLSDTHRPYPMGTVFRKSHFDAQMEFFYEAIMAIWRLKGPEPAKIELGKLLAVSAIDQDTVSQIKVHTNDAVRIVQTSSVEAAHQPQAGPTPNEGTKDSAMFSIPGTLNWYKKRLESEKESVRREAMAAIARASETMASDDVLKIVDPVLCFNWYEDVRVGAIHELLGGLGIRVRQQKLFVYLKKIVHKLEDLLEHDYYVGDDGEAHLAITEGMKVATVEELAKLTEKDPSPALLKTAGIRSEWRGRDLGGVDTYHYSLDPQWKNLKNVIRLAAAKALVKWGSKRMLIFLLQYPEEKVRPEAEKEKAEKGKNVRQEAKERLEKEFKVTQNELVSAFKEALDNNTGDSETLALVAKELGGLGDKNVIDDLWAALSRAHSQQDQALHRGVYFDMRKFYAEAVVALWELGADVDRVEQELKWLRGRDILTRKEISEIRDRIKEKEASVNASPEVPELAAASDASQEVGGIALNAKLMDLQIKRDSHGVPLPISQQPLDRINIQGFVPQIISIQPVDLSALLGLSGSLTGASKDGIVGKI